MPPDTTVDATAARVHAQVLASGAALPDAGGLAAMVRCAAPLLPLDAVDAVVRTVAARVLGLGPLEPVLADPAVTEVMLNGPGPVWVERSGVVDRTAITVDRNAIDLLVERITAPLGLRADRTTPVVDARLPDGSRVNIVVPPLAIDGPCVTIRRFGATPIELDAMCGAEVAALLRWMVAARWNVVVSGGTGAGKTTLLNALAGHLPPHERVITVEDAAELRLPGDHVVRLESRPPSPEGTGEVRIRALVRNALRMRPDRIVVGEVRGGETLDMLQAMNTGHEGSLSTCHANGPDDALRRLETMVLFADADLPLAAVREQLAAAVDAIVHVARAGNGARRVRAVAEVVAEPARAERTRVLAVDGHVVAAPERPARA
jgi:pilus assembly protein CpaF